MKARRWVEFTLNELHSIFLDDKKFDRIYQEWVKSNYHKQKIPSIDRINCKIWYTISNIQILSWSENRYKQSMERRCRKWKVASTICGEIHTIFSSQREAVIKTWITQSSISMVLNGKRKTAWWFWWVYYENPELVTNV